MYKYTKTRRSKKSESLVLGGGHGYNPSNIHLWAQQFAADGQSLTQVYCFTDVRFEYMGKRLRISKISITEQEITIVYRGNDRQLKIVTQ